MNHDRATQELQKPLDRAHVHEPKKFGPKGHYIEAWHAQAEANRIFGHFEWSQEVVESVCVSQVERKIGQAQKDGWGVTYTARVRIAVDGVVREDFGAGHGYDVDLGLAHESAVKEAVSDAMKRALKSFGNPFGLALYDKTQANVADGEAMRREEEAAAQREVQINSKIAEMQTCETEEELDAFVKSLPSWMKREEAMKQAGSSHRKALQSDPAQTLAGG